MFSLKKLKGYCIIALSVLSLLASGSFSVCSAAEDIVFLVSPTPTVEKMIEMIPEFEKQTGIKVTVESVSYDSMMEKETLDLRTKVGAYDAFWIEAPYLGRYTTLKGIEPLEDFVKKSGLDLSDFPQSLLENFSYEGKLYALPFEGCLTVMAYRTDLFQKKGLSVPRSWTEYGGYLDVIKKVHNPPTVYGTSLMGARHEALFYEYLNFLWGFGGKLFEENLYPAISSSQAKAALRFYKSLIPYAPPGTLSYTWTESATAFQQGNVGIEVIFSDWTAALQDPTASKVVGKWAYIPLPGNGPTAFGGYGWAINANSKHKEAAFKFMSWATSKKIQRELLKLGSTPTRISILKDPELIAKFPYLSVYEQVAPRAQPPMKIKTYHALYDSLVLYLSGALAGTKTVTEALDTAQQKWVEIMKQSGYIK